jgi:hypothetical protein
MIDEVERECPWREAEWLPSCAFAAHVAQRRGGFKNARTSSLMADKSFGK